MLKKITSLLVAICVCFSTPITSFAAEPEQTEVPSITVKGTRSVDYGYDWIDGSDSGSFTVNTSNSGTIGITLKIESNDSSAFAYCSIKKPNGSYYAQNIYVDQNSGGGDGVVMTAYFQQSGTYTIEYMAYSSTGTRIMCWIY